MIVSDGRVLPVVVTVDGCSGFVSVCMRSDGIRRRSQRIISGIINRLIGDVTAIAVTNTVAIIAATEVIIG